MFLTTRRRRRAAAATAGPRGGLASAAGRSACSVERRACAAAPAARGRGRSRRWCRQLRAARRRAAGACRYGEGARRPAAAPCSAGAPCSLAVVAPGRRPEPGRWRSRWPGCRRGLRPVWPGGSVAVRRGARSRRTERRRRRGWSSGERRWRSPPRPRPAPAQARRCRRAAAPSAGRRRPGRVALVRGVVGEELVPGGVDAARIVQEPLVHLLNKPVVGSEAARGILRGHACGRLFRDGSVDPIQVTAVRPFPQGSSGWPSETGRRPAGVRSGRTPGPGRRHGRSGHVAADGQHRAEDREDQPVPEQEEAADPR